MIQILWKEKGNMPLHIFDEGNEDCLEELKEIKNQLKKDLPNLDLIIVDTEDWNRKLD
jgi:hypothetical protein